MNTAKAIEILKAELPKHTGELAEALKVAVECLVHIQNCSCNRTINTTTDKD